MWVEQRDYKRVGTILEQARTRARLTQAELARALRKPQSFVSNCESGQRRVDVLELLVIADALGADPERVFRDIVGVRLQKRSKTLRR